jgi:DNA-binding response OmpR family regulator
MKNLTLLYIEDDVEALEDVVFLLKRTFSTIYTACDGEEGLEVFKKNSIDIVLSDINIPKGNGLQLATKIRELDENIPIIFLTAHCETPKLLSAINLQAISYIIKPFNIEELKNSIIKAIKIVNKDKKSSNKILLNNNFYWDESIPELYYKEEIIYLTKNEILLVQSLFQHRNRFLTAEELGEIIFIDKKVETNSIVQMLSRFKNKTVKKINNDCFFIENIYGRGYVIK